MGRCVILREVWTPGVQVTWVTQTRVAFPRGVTSSAEGHILRVNTFLREHQMTASTKHNSKR